MRINTEAFNVGKINTQPNQSLTTRSLTKGYKHGIINNFDRVSISPMGKASSLVESLNKQREQIQERKSELVASNKEKGDNPSSIKDQLNAFDEQLKEIDNQIMKATISQLISQPTKSPTESSYSKNSTNVQNSNMNQILSLSNGLEKAKIIDSVKNNIQGQASVLKAEMKQDGSSDTKLAKVQELEVQANQLQKGIMDTLVEVTNKVEESNDFEESKLDTSSDENNGTKNATDKDDISSNNIVDAEKGYTYNKYSNDSE